MALKYSNILFDLDGTLADSAPDIILSLRKAFADIMGKDSVNIKREYIGLQLKDVLYKIHPTINEQEHKNITQAFRCIYDYSGFPGTRLYAGVLDTLLEMKKNGCAIFIVTNKPINPTLDILNKLSINIFSDVACPNCVVGKKMSKSEMVAYVINKWKLNRSKTIMIGDTESDITAAKNNTIPSVLALYGYGNKADKLKADYCIENISSLKGIIFNG